MVRLARGRGGGAGRVVVGLSGCGAEAEQEDQPEECFHHAGRLGGQGRWGKVFQVGRAGGGEGECGLRLSDRLKPDLFHETARSGIRGGLDQ